MTELREAMLVVRKHLEQDPAYRQGWIANIAMAVVDQSTPYESLHKIANNGAVLFINRLINDR